MSRNVEPIQLMDDDGSKHTYSATLMRPRHGRKMLKNILSTIERSASSVQDVNVALAQIMEGKSSASGMLAPIAELLLADEVFFHTLMKDVFRDGEAATESTMDSWYIGNYGEMVEAMLWVIAINFAAPLVRWVQRLSDGHPLVKLMGSVLENAQKSGSVS